jgi:hypothetical protein
VVPTGNLIFTVSKTALQVTISIKEAAAADDPLKFLYDESGGAVSTVFACRLPRSMVLAHIP